MTFFCPLPWCSISSGAQGRLRVCCHQSVRDFNACLVDLDPKRLLEHNREVQAIFNAGNVPAGCEPCRELERIGAISPRMQYLERFGDRAAVESRGEIQYLDLTLDNHCGLACLMCSPKFSNRLNATWSRLYPESEPVSPWRITMKEELLKEVLPTLRTVTLTGGEPFLSRETLALLQRIARDGFAEKITLRIFTNFTHRNRELEETLRKFRRSEIIASIDAVGSDYDWIRYPASYGRVVRNLSGFIREKSANVDVSVHCVAMAPNWLAIPQFLKATSEIEGLAARVPSVTRLEGPGFLKPDVLAPSEYEMGRRRIANALDDIATNSEADRVNIQNWRAILSPQDLGCHQSHAVDYLIYMRKLKALQESGSR